LLALIPLLLIGCGPSRSGPDLAELSLTSLSFGDEDPIPERHTCDGDEVSPQLAFDDVPDSAESLVLVMDDPDAPDGLYVHWVVYDLPPGIGELAEGADPTDFGARLGENSADQLGYKGPCPLEGEHRYFFKLFAVDLELGDLGQPDANQVLARLEGHLVGTGGLMGTYESGR